MLTKEQGRRYARQLFLEEVGTTGQERLLSSTVRLLGDTQAVEEAATYLGAAGVGCLVVDTTLEQRLGPRLRRLNPDVRIETHGQPDLSIIDMHPDTRLTGSIAALSALIGLSQAGAPVSFPQHEITLQWHQP